MCCAIVEYCIARKSWYLHVCVYVSMDGCLVCMTYRLSLLKILIDCVVSFIVAFLSAIYNHLFVHVTLGEKVRKKEI